MLPCYHRVLSVLAGSTYQPSPLIFLLLLLCALVVSMRLSNVRRRVPRPRVTSHGQEAYGIVA